MNKYLISLLLFILIYLIVIITSYMLSKKDEDKLKVKSRNNRSFNRKSRYSTSFKHQVSNSINKKANTKKKYKTETMCLQAGFEWSYGEFKIYCISTAIALPLIMLIVMHNIYLTVAFAFIGYNIPGQVIKGLSNKRVIKMETQVGSFLRMVIERYKNNKDLSKSIALTLPDFKGQDPFYSELKKTVVDIDLGIPLEEALDGLARRTGSIFLLRFSDYYKISSNLATHSLKVELLTEAFKQYEEKRKTKSLLRREILGPVRDCYMIMLATPILMIYQSFLSEGYLSFMINDKTGQMGLAGIVLVLLGCIWFINAKIGAPID